MLKYVGYRREQDVHNQYRVSRFLSITHSVNVRTYLNTSLFILLPRLGVVVSGDIFEVGGRDMILELGPGVTFAGWQAWDPRCNLEFMAWGVSKFLKINHKWILLDDIPFGRA